MSLNQAYLAIHLAALFFGLAGIFGALIHASAEFITMARALFATLVLLSMLLLRRGSLFPTKILGRPKSFVHLLGASLFLSLHWLSFFLAVKKGGVAIATLGFASFPAFTILVEYVIAKDPMYRNDVLAIGLITFGLILVNPSFSFHDQATIGLLWGIFSGFSFALFTFLNRNLSQQGSALQIALWQNIGVLLLCLPWTWHQVVGVSAQDWLWSAMLGVFCTAFAHYLIIRSLQRLKARHAGIVIALEPVYAIIFAAILFQQYPNLKIILGAILIIGTIVWSQHQQQRLEKT